jgi:hypothetical protein
MPNALIVPEASMAACDAPALSLGAALVPSLEGAVLSEAGGADSVTADGAVDDPLLPLQAVTSSESAMTVALPERRMRIRVLLGGPEVRPIPRIERVRCPDAEAPGPFRGARLPGHGVRRHSL